MAPDPNAPVLQNPALSYEPTAERVSQEDAKKQKKNVLPVLLIFALIFIVVFMMLLRTVAPNQTAGPAAPTPTTQIFPTPAPVLSAIATTSAFMAFDEDVASLSAIVNAFSFDDTTLVAPVVDTDLGIGH